MWQRFTERARNVVWAANAAALRLEHGTILPEHLLLGLLGERGAVADRLLLALGVDAAALASEVKAALPPEDEVAPTEVVALHVEGKRMVDFAYREARALGDDYIGTQHLLLGLALVGGAAGGLADPDALAPERVRDAVARSQAEE